MLSRAIKIQKRQVALIFIELPEIIIREERTLSALCLQTVFNAWRTHNTEELAETLCTASKGRYTKSKTAEIQVAAGVSIG